MAGAVWVVGEVVDGHLARIGAELGTLGRALAADAGCDLVGIVVDAQPDVAANELAAYVPHTLAISLAAVDAERVSAGVIADALAALAREKAPDWILLGATPDGRDIAGILAAALDWGVLVNAIAVTWDDGGPNVQMSTFGGRLLTP